MLLARFPVGEYHNHYLGLSRLVGFWKSEFTGMGLVEHLNLYCCAAAHNWWALG